MACGCPAAPSNSRRASAQTEANSSGLTSPTPNSHAPSCRTRISFWSPPDPRERTTSKPWPRATRAASSSRPESSSFPANSTITNRIRRSVAILTAMSIRLARRTCQPLAAAAWPKASRRAGASATIKQFHFRMSAATGPEGAALPTARRRRGSTSNCEARGVRGAAFRKLESIPATVAIGVALDEEKKWNRGGKLKKAAALLQLSFHQFDSASQNG